MKTKVLMFAMLMSISAVLVAQPADNGPRKSFPGQNREMRMNKGQGGPAGLNLTDAQKEAFKQSMLATQKQIQPLRNELGEAQAHQKTLMTADKPDLSAINKNIEKIGSIKTEIAKIRAKQRIDMRAQLTDEQRLKFDRFKGEMMQRGWFKGMRHGMGMEEEHSMN